MHALNLISEPQPCGTQPDTATLRKICKPGYMGRRAGPTNRRLFTILLLANVIQQESTAHTVPSPDQQTCSAWSATPQATCGLEDFIHAWDLGVSAHELCVWAAGNWPVVSTD